jgi:hypothetical protein
MKDTHFYLKKFIREALDVEDSKCQKFDAYRGYYDMDPNNPFSISDVIDGWVSCGLKARETETYQALYSPEELWPYREYTWSSDTAGGLEVTGIDKETYQDKWHFVPQDDEGKIVGRTQWDHMYEELKKKGWNKNKPAYLEIGKNGVAKVGEGNHRLAIAMELGIPVPVFFSFKSTVHLSGASNRS